MKKLPYLIAFVVLILIIIVMVTGTDEGYEQTVLDKRNERISFLRNSAESPFRKMNKPFVEPEYFPVDMAYRVNATLKRLEGKKRRTIQNSDGTSDQYIEFALATFRLRDTDCQLLILKPAGFGQVSYFTAFADETSTVTTYGAGRYLDLEIGKSDKVVIDFNLAYNPYCAYVDGFTCPFPPKENILPIAIEAGEKLSKQK